MIAGKKMAETFVLASTETDDGRRSLRSLSVVNCIACILFFAAAVFFGFAPSLLFSPS